MNASLRFDAFSRAGRLLCAIVSALVLLGCAHSYGPGGLAPGATSAQVIERMGPPTGRYPLPGGGQRLEFARGPYGKHTYMLDFDSGDRLTKTEQVLTEAKFLTLQVGMSEAEVLSTIGHPSDARFLSRQQHQLWSYRYDTPFCIWYQVSIAASTKQVAELGHNMDPACSGDFFPH